jgi:GTP-binding protein LepA
MDAIYERIPAPEVVESDITRALIFDSVYDPYRGVVSYVKVVE